MHKLSYSQIRLFQTCPRAFRYRYIDRIEPIADRPITLRAGSAFHHALDRIYRSKGVISSFDAVASVDAEFAKADLGSSTILTARAKTRAMVDAYLHRYGIDRNVVDNDMTFGAVDPKYTIIASEIEFAGQVVNPETGAKSRTFEIGGKIDAIVKDLETGEYLIMEHKTTSAIGPDFVEKLWTDYQVHLYAYYARVTLGIPVTGVLYNVVQTCPLKRREPETDEEFAVRYAELCAKNKSGKSSATQNTGETWDEYTARCIEWYQANPDAFLRTQHKFNAEKVAEIQAAVWDIGQTMIDIRRADRYHRNPAQCFPLAGRTCDFEPLCRSCDNPIIRDNLYRVRPELNQELGTPADSGF